MGGKKGGGEPRRCAPCHARAPSETRTCTPRTRASRSRGSARISLSGRAPYQVYVLNSVLRPATALLLVVIVILIVGIVLMRYVDESINVVCEFCPAAGSRRLFGSASAVDGGTLAAFFSRQQYFRGSGVLAFRGRSGFAAAVYFLRQQLCAAAAVSRWRFAAAEVSRQQRFRGGSVFAAAAFSWQQCFAAAVFGSSVRQQRFRGSSVHAAAAFSGQQRFLDSSCPGGH